MTSSRLVRSTPWVNMSRAAALTIRSRVAVPRGVRARDVTWLSLPPDLGKPPLNLDRLVGPEADWSAAPVDPWEADEEPRHAAARARRGRAPGPDPGRGALEPAGDQGRRLARDLQPHRHLP